MKIKQNENELIIEETPGCLWIFGSFFAAVGAMAVYGALGGFTNWNEASTATLYLFFLMGAIAVGVGVWIIYSAPATKVVINRQTKTVVHARRGLAGKREKRYDFEQIKQFCLIEGKDSEGDPIWSLGMELCGGETIVISALQSRSEKYKRDFVFQTNEFMHKQIASSQMIFEIEDKNEAKAR